MSEGNVYEAATEVRDGIQRLHQGVVEEINGLGLAIEDCALSRREQWAGALFVMLVQMAVQKGINPVDTLDGRQLAAKAWQLASMLDLADPHTVAAQKGHDESA